MPKLKESILLEVHHRRPTSLGGSKSKANTSYVKPKFHDAWNTIAGNMNAFQTSNLLNEIKYKPIGVKIVCKFINGSQVKGSGKNNSKNKEHLYYAWNVLFRGLSFKQIIEYINNVWLDPSYHLYLEEIL